jgi:hypothetical protein
MPEHSDRCLLNQILAHIQKFLTEETTSEEFYSEIYLLSKSRLESEKYSEKNKTISLDSSF